MANKRILLVEDEPGVILTLGDRLRSEGYEVTCAVDGVDGERKGAEYHFDLIILDVMLPLKNGFDVCKDLRQQGIRTPILMLTALGQLDEKVLGLKLGADDYQTKPFEMAELLARVETLLRRPAAFMNGMSTLQHHTFGDVEVDFKTMEVRKNGQIVELSAREFQLLRYFVEHRNVVLTRDAILGGVWGYETLPTTRTIDTHVTWLRQKLEIQPHHPQYILTVHGRGYKFAG